MTSPGWDVRHVPGALPGDDVRSGRRMKILCHEYLADYDESLYLDNTVVLKVPPETLFEALLPPEAPMALLHHSFRGPVRDEFSAVIEQGRDARWVCEEQLATYE